jgi:hypothetical protein
VDRASVASGGATTPTVGEKRKREISPGSAVAGQVPDGEKEEEEGDEGGDGGEIKSSGALAREVEARNTKYARQYTFAGIGLSIRTLANNMLSVSLFTP